MHRNQAKIILPFFKLDDPIVIKERIPCYQLMMLNWIAPSFWLHPTEIRITGEFVFIEFFF